MLEEKISKNLGEPYIFLPKEKKFLLKNGVLFTLEEYEKGIDVQAEYERRAKEDMLYDYSYAKSTGILRKKRGYTVSEVTEKVNDTETSIEKENTIHNNSIDKNMKKINNIIIIVVMLLFTSVISMYISTRHTADYLISYVDIFSAYVMSLSVTAYNTVAFEVSVLFYKAKRQLMSFIFMFLWVLVTLFSMVTTVSVFYDRFNFNELQTVEDNKEVLANKLQLDLLQAQEKALREDIDFKRKDIVYRQEKDYATTAVRIELENLQKDLQENLNEQKALLTVTPIVANEKITKKESLFAFIARLAKIDSGILEFIMSTLSAIFVNIIAPLSLTAFIELNKGEKNESN